MSCFLHYPKWASYTELMISEEVFQYQQDGNTTTTQLAFACSKELCTLSHFLVQSQQPTATLQKIFQSTHVGLTVVRKVFITVVVEFGNFFCSSVALSGLNHFVFSPRLFTGLTNSFLREVVNDVLVKNCHVARPFLPSPCAGSARITSNNVSPNQYLFWLILIQTLSRTVHLRDKEVRQSIMYCDVGRGLTWRNVNRNQDERSNERNKEVHCMVLDTSQSTLPL